MEPRGAAAGDGGVDSPARAEPAEGSPAVPEPAEVASREGEPGPVRWFRRLFVVYWPLLIVFALALGVRVWAVSTWLPACPSTTATRSSLDDCYAVGGDAYYYSSMARNVADGNGFTVLSYSTLTNVDLADHPPGYVLFLAMLDKAGLTSFQAHRYVLAFVGAAGASLVGLLGWRLGGRRERATGVTAGVLAAVYPGFWMSDAYYMSESIFVPLIALTLLCAYRLWREPRMLNAVFLGAAAGGAWLVRGEAALLLGLIAVGFVLMSRAVTFWRRVLLGGVASAVCVGLMVPWVVYNLNRFDEPVYVTTTGTAFALNSCDDVWYGEATGWYSFGCLNAYTAITLQEDGVVTDAGVRARATAYIRENLAEYPRVATVRVLRVLGLYSVDDTIDRNYLAEGRKQDGVLTQVWMYYPMAALAIAGLVLLRRRRVPISPLVATLLAVVATVATSFPIFRYRLALDTAIVPAAAVALVAGGVWIASRMRRARGEGSDAEDPRPAAPEMRDESHEPLAPSAP
ncbi:MAG: glycosyltransferase family 39 protein [Actinobacteria bacterium]|nr:glycosyltransferase family 39 protein [Actinomycetota bacterium]